MNTIRSWLCKASWPQFLQASKARLNTQNPPLSHTFLNRNKKKKGRKKASIFLLQTCSKSSPNSQNLWRLVLAWRKTTSCGVSWRICGGKSDFSSRVRGNPLTLLVFPFSSRMKVNFHGFTTLSKKIG